MSTKLDLSATFYKPILKAAVVVLGGFLLAPTQILLSLYEAYPAFKSTVIFAGFFIVFFALINMISVSLKAINGAALDRKGVAAMDD